MMRLRAPAALAATAFAALSWTGGDRSAPALVTAAAAGFLVLLAGLPLLEASLGAPRAARAATALLAVLAAGALLVFGPRAALALGLLLVTLGGAWDGRAQPLARWGAPAAALAAAWAHPGIGVAALCALVILFAGTLPLRERLRAEGLPQLAGLAIALVGLVLLPLALLPVSRVLRVALLAGALVVSLVAGRLVATATLDARGRRVILALAAAIPALALLALVALQPRRALLPPTPGAAALAALVVLSCAVVAVGLLVGFTLLLSTGNRARGWALALLVGAPAGWIAGGAGAAVALLPVVAIAATVGALLYTSKNRAQRPGGDLRIRPDPEYK